MGLEEVLRKYKEYRNLRRLLGLPDFTTNNPSYIPGQELQYIKKQLESRGWPKKPALNLY